MKCKKNVKSIKEYSAGDGKYQKYNSALQADIAKSSPSYSFITRTFRVFLCVFGCRNKKWKGSFTVEAAVVFPVFLYGMFVIMEILDIYRVQALVRSSIHESAMELAGSFYKNEVENMDGESVFCILYGKKNLPELGKRIKISLGRTTCEKEKIHMVADIEYHFWMPFFVRKAIHTTSSCIVYCWKGWDGTMLDGKNGDLKQMVYVTEYESVYHTSSFCTHLNLEINHTTKDKIGLFRNKYGEKYHPCEICGKKGGESVVYYTKTGNRYHTSTRCHGLTRKVVMTDRLQVKDRSQCERCREMEKNEMDGFGLFGN